MDIDMSITEIDAENIIKALKYYIEVHRDLKSNYNIEIDDLTQFESILKHVSLCLEIEQDIENGTMH